MTTAELLIRCLEHEEVRIIFGVPGEETLDITDALLDSRIQFIPTRHEQDAAKRIVLQIAVARTRRAVNL